MAWHLSRTVPHLLSWPTATLPRMRFWFAILPTCSVCPTWRFCAIFRTIPRAPRACIPSATDVRRSTVAYIKEHAGEFPGVKIAERTERQYPYGETACHILGYTGTITSEQLEAQNKKTSGDDDASAGRITYQSGDIVGQAGVESYYENLLQGIRGEQTVKVDASGNVTGQAGAVPAKAGSDIKLTLDLKIQQACETALAERHRACQDHWLQQCRQRRCGVSRSQQRRDPGHGERAQVRSVRLYRRRLK